MAENNERKIAGGIERRIFALIATVMLVGMAIMGIFMITPQADAMVSEVDYLVLDLTATPDTIYSHSDETVAIAYTLNSSLDVDMSLDNVTIVLYHGASGMEWTLYEWNLSVDGVGTEENPYNYQYDGSLVAGAYQINVTVDYFNSANAEGFSQTEMTSLTIVDGSGMLNTVDATPDTVPGTGSVNVSWTVDRDMADIDEVSLSIYNNNEDMWAVHNGSLLETMAGMDQVMYWYIFDIADQAPTDYNVDLYVLDSWGYSEAVNDTLITVTEAAPVNVTDLESFEFDEDGMLTVDLSLLFDDHNGDDLLYYINLSDTGDLIVEMYGENMINVSAAMDWYGEDQVTVWVDDGNGNNVSFILYFAVIMVDDELVEGDLTIYIDENLGNTTFDPILFFEDIDGPEYAVSLGWDWVTDEWNNTNKTAIWEYTDEGNVTVTIDNVTGEGFAQLLDHFEEGSWEFSVTAWVAGEPVLNATANVMVDEVNDPIELVTDTLTTYVGEAISTDIRDLFTDNDNGPEDFVFTLISYDSTTLVVDYNATTFMLNVTSVADDFEGTSIIGVNATDGIEELFFNITVEFIPMTYTVSGTISFEYEEGAMTDLVNVTLTIGEVVVTFNETGYYEIELEAGTYSVVVTVPEGILYDEDALKSGYLTPADEDINVSADMTHDILIEYEEYVPTVVPATWADIDFAGANIEKESGDISVIVPVDGTKNGYNDLNIYFVVVNKEIEDGDDEVVEFLMEFNGTHFVLDLTSDDLKEVNDGKRMYLFRDDLNNTYTADNSLEFEFKEKEVEDGLITVIVLIVLIVLVLIALVFIMRKPAEEEYEDEGDEDEESSERVCPSCGEIVTDEDATECPECGEELKEE